MTELPVNTVSIQDVFEWYKLQEELKKVKAKETLLRLKVFKGLFPAPVEGTNTLDLAEMLSVAGLPPDGYVMKGGHVINRDVDEAALKVLTPEFVKAGIRSDLVKWKPSLAVTEYRKLTDEQRHLFDQCLIVKDGMPALEIVLPKKKGKAGATNAGDGNN